MGKTYNNSARVKSPKPFDERLQTDDLATLLLIENKYTQMFVWVASEKSFYYLISGDGSLITDWEKLEIEKARFIPYDTNETYILGDCVTIGGNFYIAKGNVAINEDPPNYPLLWERIGFSEIEFDFVSQQVVVIPHSYNSPRVVAYIDWGSGEEYTLVAPDISNPTEITIDFGSVVSGTVTISE